jgi:hypothetical protein
MTAKLRGLGGLWLGDLRIGLFSGLLAMQLILPFVLRLRKKGGALWCPVGDRCGDRHLRTLGSPSNHGLLVLVGPGAVDRLRSSGGTRK